MSDDVLAFFLDLKPKLEDLRSAVVEGLSKEQKSIPPKFFYDDAGSVLFDEICELPEYYVTRTEIGILQANAKEIGEAIEPRATIIEYGCGSSLKIRSLLDALIDPAGYVAIDISREHLRNTAVGIANDYPDLHVGAICADFTSEFAVPDDTAMPIERTVGFFPGSTLGNQRPGEAQEFLAGVRRQIGDDGGLLIGVDLRKNVDRLHAAYNDSAGVTAAFNLNLLTRIKRELGAELDVSGFVHDAFFNAKKSRVEMHLKSLSAQTITIDDHVFEFAAGETIHTENSHKYDLTEFADFVKPAGFTVASVWTDDKTLFSVQYLKAI